MRQAKSGFTLIELMIVVTIIGVLAIMATPIYRDRVIRKQVEEGLELSSLATQKIEEFYQRTGEIPGNNRTAGLPEAGKIIGNYVTGIEVVGGAINIVFGNRVHKDIRGKILTLRPAVVADEPSVPIAWVCGYAQQVEGMQIRGFDQTSFLAQELPIDCRI
jgi:type IV pilus assembly protein PilA